MRAFGRRPCSSLPWAALLWLAASAAGCDLGAWVPDPEGAARDQPDLGSPATPSPQAAAADPSPARAMLTLQVAVPAAPQGPAEAPSAPPSAAGGAATPSSPPGSAPRAPASGAEIEALIGALRAMTPPQKVKAYEKMIADGQTGLDEVFLVGLNEDDPDILRVVVAYFVDRHPPDAIEPLVDVLMFVQGDAALRTHVARALASFGAPALGPVMARLEAEPEARLEGGAMKGFGLIFSQLFEGGGPQVLNQFLNAADREDLRRLLPLTGDATGGALPADAATVALIAGGLEAELRRPRPEAEIVDVWLQLICRIGQGDPLPPEVARLAPLIGEASRWSGGLWGLYAAALVGDASTARALAASQRGGGLRRFWALQAVGIVGDASTVPVILDALAAEEPDLRAMAAWCVRHRLWSQAAPALRRTLAEPGAPQLAVIEALGALEDPASRPLLEASLAGSPREVQAAALRALLTVGDRALAQRIQGWMELELLAPGRAGRVELDVGPSREVVEAGLTLVAAYGGAEVAPFVEQAARQLKAGRGSVPRGAAELARAIDGGLAPVLREAFLADGADASAGRFVPLGPALLLLAGPLDGPGVREAVEAVLLESPLPAARAAAAQALYFVGTRASIPALTRALEDPWFVDGPFPLFEHPVRRLAARALERLRVSVIRGADRRYRVGRG